MTLEELLDCSAEQLEAMSDQQLLEFFKPYLNVTRPELAPKPVRTLTQKYNSDRSETQRRVQNLDPKKLAALKALAAEDPEFDMSFLTRKKR